MTLKNGMLALGLLCLSLLSVQAVCAEGRLTAQTARAGAARAEGRELELTVQTGHGGAVVAAAFSPDGRLALSGGTDRTVILWEVATGRMLRALPGQETGVSSLSFSPDGGRALCLAENGVMRLWDVKTGRPVATLNERSALTGVLARCAVFTPDGAHLLTGGYESATLWDPALGKAVRTFEGNEDCPITAAAVTPEGRVLGGCRDGTILVWNLATGERLMALRKHRGAIAALAAAPGGKLLISGSADGTMIVWDLAAGTAVKTIPGFDASLAALLISRDGASVISSGSGGLWKWELSEGPRYGPAVSYPEGAAALAVAPDGGSALFGRRDRTLELFGFRYGDAPRLFRGYACGVAWAALSADGRRACVLGADGALCVWDLAAGQVVIRYDGLRAGAGTQRLFPDGRRLLFVASDGSLKIRDLDGGKDTPVPERASPPVSAVCLSPDGTRSLDGHGDGSLHLRELPSGREIASLSSLRGPIRAVAFLGSDRLLAADGGGRLVTWSAQGAVRGTEWQCPFPVHDLAVSPDGRHVLVDTGIGTTVWDSVSGREAGFFGHKGEAPAAFSPDGSRLLFGQSDGSLTLERAPTGDGAAITLRGHSCRVTSICFSGDGRYALSGSLDGTTRLWDVAARKEVAALFSLDRREWAVVDPDGRFDGSSGGMKMLHWVTGIESMALEQLKTRCFEPGLLPKLLKLSTAPLRPYVPLEAAAPGPAPEVSAELSTGDDGTLLVSARLTNRGGGIGRVQVLVNGVEFCADARRPGARSGEARADAAVSLAGAPLAVGESNVIRIVAWNGDGSLSGSGLELPYTVHAYRICGPPRLWIIAGGISTYADERLRLRFAAKDAEDVARALRVGADRLFGAQNVRAAVLSSSGRRGTVAPTKANFRKAFDEARGSEAQDVLLVYLSGHGVSLAEGKDLYCYLTQEASSADLKAPPDAQRLGRLAITSEELVEWMRQVPARKKVLILDTCAAGAAAGALLARRDVPGDQVRAIERLKDRTGFHVLMGCAGDAVSYEASRFGQGLLTYSLLQGMKGAALRDDRYVDVTKLFQYSADNVPLLARDLGGIQRPAVAAPEGTSFDVGALEEEDRQAIPLAAVKPMILRPMFINGDQDEDDLKLSTAVARGLRRASLDDEDGRFVYVDGDDLPGAIRATGKYRLAGSAVTVTVKLRRGEESATWAVEGSAEALPRLVEAIVESIIRKCAEL